MCIMLMNELQRKLLVFCPIVAVETRLTNYRYLVDWHIFQLTSACHLFSGSNRVKV